MITESIVTVQRRHNGHWFDADTMRFFSSRVSDTAYNDENGHSYFVSSERDTYRNRQPKRLYTVRVQNTETGDIDTVGDFQGYSTRYQAHKAAQELASQ